MIRDDLRRKWEVADPVHVISRALLDHVIVSQRNRESLFQEPTLPSMTSWYWRYSYQCYSKTHCMGVYRCVRQCVCVASSSECLHKCWFCSSKPFNSAFFHRLSPLCCALISSPLFIATQLASSPFASIRHTYLFITPFAPSNPAKKQKKTLPPPPPFTGSCKQHEVADIKQYPTLEKGELDILWDSYEPWWWWKEWVHAVWKEYSERVEAGDKRESDIIWEPSGRQLFRRRKKNLLRGDTDYCDKGKKSQRFWSSRSSVTWGENGKNTDGLCLWVTPSLTWSSGECWPYFSGGHLTCCQVEKHYHFWRLHLPANLKKEQCAV